MKDEEIRLNPFVYISETDIRFYLLVLIGTIMPIKFTIGYLLAAFRSIGLDIDSFIKLFIFINIMFFYLIIIYFIYKRFPKKTINQFKLKDFDKPNHCKYIGELHEEYLPNVKLPALKYQPMDVSFEAFTFGTKKQLYLYIPGGLVTKFHRDINVFRSIFLHEMGHIVNKDVEKLYIAYSTWQSLFITLFIPFGINLILNITLIITTGLLMIITGFDMDLVAHVAKLVLTPGFLFRFLYLIIFLTILYILRKQLIRLREFYADARVLEWEKSPVDIIRTLEESGGKLYSRFEILKRFHPNINERIDALRNNSSLFIPSLWVAFTLGFSYEIIETYFMEIIAFILGYFPEGYSYSLLKAPISIFIFTFLMIAVSSIFHRSVLKDVLIKNKMYFSSNRILDIVKFSFVFSLGQFAVNILDSVYIMPRYEINELIEDSLLFIIFRINDFIHLSLVLIFLLFFSSMLLQRSFTKKDADKNFYMITSFSSILFIVNSGYYLNEAILLIFLLFIIFSVIAYIFIKIKDRRLCCPNCNNKILNLSELKLNCPNCQHNLYSWAIYSF